MEPSLIADVALPTTAAGIILLVINTIANRVIEIRKARNGGTAETQVVKVLESIDSKMDEHKAALGKIAVGVEDLIRNEEIAVIVAERVATKLRVADEERARDIRQREGG